MKRLLILPIIFLLGSCDFVYAQSKDTVSFPCYRTSDSVYIPGYWGNVPCIHDSTLIIFSVDTNRIVTVPRGWQYIIVIEGGECWMIDSSLRSYSHPESYLDLRERKE
jgi:hypothetical protein